VANSLADGAPYLVPLSFDWEGEALLMATSTKEYQTYCSKLV
jgi:nitroimidazol reductase NimA-like FMN-containing flavoprotein (pyridoxamine 5'-phosphate oxidase superfamily)